MTSRNVPRPSAAKPPPSRGYVLVTSLILLLVLTLVAVTAMQYTQIEITLSANNAYHDQAFQSSESARGAVEAVLDAHVHQRAWNERVPLPGGLEPIDNDGDGQWDVLFLGNDDLETLTETASLVVDAVYHSAGGKIDADVAVYQTERSAAAGAGQCMSCGYQGLGKGAAGGGLWMFFELRSVGHAMAGARATTSSDYRVVVDN